MDPASTEESRQAEEGAPEENADGTAKIDPTLPGSTHPAHKGVPALDTIAETTPPGSAPGGQGNSQGQSSSTAPSQAPSAVSSSIPTPGQSGGAGQATTNTATSSTALPQGHSALSVATSSGHSASEAQVAKSPASQDGGPLMASSAGSSAAQGQAHTMNHSQSPSTAPGTARTPGHSGASHSASSEPEGADDTKVERPGHRQPYATPLASAASSDVLISRESSVGGQESGRVEEYAGSNLDASPHPRGAGKVSSDATSAEHHEAQHGAHKIPVNPPYESDDDEDQQEHDANHPEGFLRSMPEDESSMRVLKLPDGRVQDVDDDEASAQASGDEEENRVGSQAAPFPAQAPLVSPASAQSRIEVAPVAEVNGTGSAPSGPGLPSANDGASLLSRENSGSLSAIEASSVVTVTGSSTPGTVSPSGMPLANLGGRESMLPQVGAAEPSSESTDKSSGVTGSGFAGTDHGVIGLQVPPSVAAPRAQSLSPIDHSTEGPGVVGPPPIAPAPPRPDVRSDVVEPQAKLPGVHASETLAPGSGSSQASGLPKEGERAPSSTPTDHEASGLLSGPFGLGELHTEIKVTNLQGQEQEVMRMVMHTQVDGRMQEVEFDFNLDYDLPEQVLIMNMEL